MFKKTIFLLCCSSLLIGVVAGCGKRSTNDIAPISRDPVTLTTVHYDHVASFFDNFNADFAKFWEQKTGQRVTITSLTGTSAQQVARVTTEKVGDVLTVASASDLEPIVSAKHISVEWEKQWSNNSVPYTSTIVFLVRKDNPKAIRDWDDLLRDDVRVVFPDPNQTTEARWPYLATLAYAQKKFSGDPVKTGEWMASFFFNASAIPPNSASARETFLADTTSDVLLAWESDAWQQQKKNENVTIVYPSVSIPVFSPIALVEQPPEQKNKKVVATAYIEHLYSNEGQKQLAASGFRPVLESVRQSVQDQFPNVPFLEIARTAQEWKEIETVHFQPGGIVSQLLATRTP